MKKLVNCKACGKEIAKGVNKCVHCGKKQKGPLGKIILGLFGLFIIISIISSGGNDKPTVVSNTSTKNVTVATPVAKPVEPTSFKVGDTIKLNDYTVKVNSASVVKNSNEFIVPKAGNEFFAVDCTITNTSNSEQTISSLMMFKIVDKDGRACEMSIGGEGGQLDGSIGAGRKMTGVYTVEAPKGTTGLELEFDGSLFSAGQIIVKLN